MFVDLLKYTGSDVSQTSAILYLKLNSGTTEFTQYQVQGNAAFGGVTGAHWRMRELLTVGYGTSTSTRYTWSGVELVKSSDGSWLCRLQQDQNLEAEWWYRGADHTTTFGTGSGQFDLTTTENKNVTAYMTTLCKQTDVEGLALSHLPGRLRFSEAQAQDEITNQVMQAGELWRIINDTSAMFQARLALHYTTPLRLGNDRDRRLLADLVAKEVTAQVFVRMHLLGGTQNLVDTVTDWRKQIEAFLDKPVGLESEERRTAGGTYRLERA